jgi:hypothetical protein
MHKMARNAEKRNALLEIIFESLFGYVELVGRLRVGEEESW